MFSREFYSYCTAALLTFVGLAAVVGGILLVFVPDGTSLGLTTELLRNTPFNNYFIPGLVLILANGVLSLIGAVLTARNHPQAGIAAILLGIVMIFWMLTQVYWLGLNSWLQSTFLAIGIVEIFLGTAIESFEENDHHRFFGKHHDSHAH